MVYAHLGQAAAAAEAADLARADSHSRDRLVAPPRIYEGYRVVANAGEVVLREFDRTPAGLRWAADLAKEAVDRDFDLDEVYVYVESAGVEEFRTFARVLLEVPPADHGDSPAAPGGAPGLPYAGRWPVWSTLFDRHASKSERLTEEAAAALTRAVETAADGELARRGPDLAEVIGALARVTAAPAEAIRNWASGDRPALSVNSLARLLLAGDCPDGAAALRVAGLVTALLDAVAARTEEQCRDLLAAVPSSARDEFTRDLRAFVAERLVRAAFDAVRPETAAS